MSNPTASDITQTIMWTALPNGVPSSGQLALSVFVSPQLSAVMSDESTPRLSVFDDFVDWPSTLSGSNNGAGISFTVTIGTGAPIAARVASGSPALDSASWQAIFVPTDTTVQPYAYQDLSNATFQSFGAKTIVENVANLYGTIGLESPTSPMLLTAQSPGVRKPPALGIYDNATLAGVVETISTLGTYDPKLGGTALQQEMFRLRRFYSYPATIAGVSGPDPNYTPPVPELDFHQALTSLGSFPVLLRRFGIVFDLVIPYTFNPDHPAPTTVQVTPSWTSSVSTTKNVSPLTNITLSATQFIAKPRGTDYVNGMIDLKDTSRFYVTDLDGDLAAHRLLTLDNVLESMQSFWSESPQYNAHSQPPYYKAAVTVPALRSNGLQIIWSNWGTPPEGLVGLLATQTNLNGQLTAFTGGSSDAPPEVYADDVMRGHRIDLYTASDPSPAWRSLHGRSGTYGIGTPTGTPTPEPPIVLTAVDEGFVTPATSQQAELLNETNTDVYVHEVWMKWDGWSLSAQRPGTSIGTDEKPQAQPGNAAVQGHNLPQISATFVTPNVAGGGTNPYPLPKLRFGSSYLLRARGVDLAGNSVPLSSSDASTAYGPVTHYRYEPVPAPVLASTAPLSIAESTWLLVLLDDQVNPITPNGRWLFPPKTNEHMAEEHGMFDGFVLGQPPRPSKPPDGSAATYDLLAGSTDTTGLADGTIPGVTGVEFDAGHGDTPYFPPTAAPVTPWLPDPLSAGAGLLGLPSEPSDDQYTAVWAPGPWPQLQPVLLLVDSGQTRSNSYSPAAGTSPAQVVVTLPPAEVAVVWLSSALTDEAAATLGVYQWIVATAGGVGNLPAGFSTWLANGQIWQCSPFRVLRMVHAVRTPLVAPALQNPRTNPQSTGDTSVGLEDADFLVDPKSTSVLDFHAQWIDPYDNPSDPKSNPGNPASFFQVKSGPAFKLHVPDPTPIGPESMPLTVYPPDVPFSFGLDEATGVNPATHFIGDTKHHLIGYQVIGTSRFAEMFETSFEGTFTKGAPKKISELGINLTTIVVFEGTTTTVVPSTDYHADATSGELTYTGSASHIDLHVDFQPTTTTTGPVVPVEVLSTLRPPAPKISKILPSWSFSGPAGDLVTGIELQRTGGYLRVFLERPWFATGAGEMLGVVTPAFETSDPTPEDQQPLYTMMGLDPINYIGTSERPWPVIPPVLGDLAKVPVVPARGAPYSSPPQLTLAEDLESGNLYNIWPYEVEYDEPTGTWYSDISLLPGQVASSGETVLPPPGYFVRLSVTRFQPYSIDYQEVSTVTTATIAQPVADRLVVVLQNDNDPTNESVLVSVVGPGYEGWRPPSTVYKDSSGHDYVKDGDNPWAPQVYEGGGQGSVHTSMMVVDVQIHDSATWLEGDLAWVTVNRPIRLEPHFSNTTTVEWGGLGGSNRDAPRGVVKLPYTLNSQTKMRLRVSELEYFEGDRPPEVVNATQRRPFVAFIPVN